MKLSRSINRGAGKIKAAVGLHILHSGAEIVAASSGSRPRRDCKKRRISLKAVGLIFREILVANRPTLKRRQAWCMALQTNKGSSQ